MNSHVLEFYSGWRADSKDRTIDDIRSWNNERLESDHGYIQWLFPLNQRSQDEPAAPILDDAQMTAFQSNAELRAEVLRSFDVMLAFYGFQRNGASIERSNTWKERTAIWLTQGNHNFHRITRILKSLSLLGLEQHSRAFFEELSRLYSSGYGQIIGSVTYDFWRDAVRQAKM